MASDQQVMPVDPIPEQNGQAGNNAGPAGDPMRAYRACLHCRSRKTKCNLDVNGGKPPCKRCMRENRECILGESHRGGRRERKRPRLRDEVGDSRPDQSPNKTEDSQGSRNGAETPSPTRHDNYDSSYPHRSEWHSASRATTERPHFLNTAQPSPYMAGMNVKQEEQNPARTQIRESPSHTHMHSRGHIAIADLDNPLNNPSDALHMLARVADQAEGRLGRKDQEYGGEPTQTLAWNHQAHPSGLLYALQYEPIESGRIKPEMVYQLFSIYENEYHVYFPVVPIETFDPSRLPWISKHEPHLFSAILTVASKHDVEIHKVCYDHMHTLVSDIVAGADANIEAVEALLVLSQWICHRPQSQQLESVGRGEEDRIAWMYIGLALRLGWYLGIEKSEYRGETVETSNVLARKKLIWSMCYIADRNVSVRIGKGFWARGPGPLSSSQETGFPQLTRTAEGHEELAMVLQAQLKLIQIFSSVHDILYSGSSWREILDGRYSKYLDDFRLAISNWHEAWGALRCSNRLKASLLLSYDYLRLYVNAFAYQATITKSMLTRRDSSERSVPLLDASTPDARFIYEAINAAKSLINTFNTIIVPEVFRYMPCRYYMYLVYSAVFLFKARSTTTMSEEERIDIRRMITTMIERLGATAIGLNHMGSRYSRLLHLLWQKNPKRPSLPDIVSHERAGFGAQPLAQKPHPQTATPQHGTGGAHAYPESSFDPTAFPANGFMPHGPGPEAAMDTMGTLSWMDLGAAWEFATQDGAGLTPMGLSLPNSGVASAGVGGVGAVGSGACGVQVMPTFGNLY